MDTMFDVLDKFVTKMQEADQRFLIFPNNLLQNGSLESLPQVINDPESTSPRQNQGSKVAMRIPQHSLAQASH